MLFTHRFSALLIIALSPLFFNNSHANKLKVGIIDFPPFYIINDAGSSSGVFLNILKKTLQHAKLDFNLDIYPTKRLYRNLGTGETQLFLGIKGPAEYNKKVLYSTTAVSQIQMRVYAIGDTPLPLAKEDINNHRIITMRGYSYGGLINYFTDPKKNIEVTSTTKHLSSFLMLKNNRADYVINYKQPSEMALANIKIPDLKYSSFYDAKIHFIVSKSTPNAEQILDKLEQAYLELIDLGELEYITNDD